MAKHARITKAFRIAIEGGGLRKYTAGDVAEGDHAAWAIANRHGVEIAAEKAAPKPKDKAKPAAPKNKSA